MTCSSAARVRRSPATGVWRASSKSTPWWISRQTCCPREARLGQGGDVSTTASRPRSATWPSHHQAAADDGLGVLDLDVLPAVRAHDPHADALAARLVQQIDWRGGKTGPLVA